MQIPEPCIYLVDDEKALAQMTRAVLGTRGYHATVFNRPEDAITHLKQNPTQSALLITDCIMGSMNGLELIEQFSKSVPDLRTILMSGTITDDFLHKCQLQPDRYLAKPYSAEVLLKAVEELLHQEAPAKKVGI